MPPTEHHYCPTLRAWLTRGQCERSRKKGTAARSAAPGTDARLAGLLESESCLPACPGVVVLSKRSGHDPRDLAGEMLNRGRPADSTVQAQDGNPRQRSSVGRSLGQITNGIDARDLCRELRIEIRTANRLLRDSGIQPLEEGKPGRRGHSAIYPRPLVMEWIESRRGKKMRGRAAAGRERRLRALQDKRDDEDPAPRIRRLIDEAESRIETARQELDALRAEIDVLETEKGDG